DDVLRAGLGGDLSPGPDDAAPTPRGILERQDHLRRGRQRVLPSFHRRRAGVTRRALDADAQVRDADDGAHDAERAPGAFEPGTLLDVQLQVRAIGPLAPGARRVAA